MALSASLQNAKANLDAQVRSKGITQAQADAELQRLTQLEQSSPYIRDAQNNLNQQVASGAITSGQAAAELERLRNQESAGPSVVTPNTQPGLDQARASLQDQVAKGWISQGAADAELQRLRTSAQSPYASSDLSLDTPSDVVNAVFDTSKGAQTQGNLLTNANQEGPFGSSSVTIDPITGQPKVTQSLSQGNQAVVGGVQGSAVKASDALGGLLGGGLFGSLTNPSGGPGGAAAPQSNFENAVFSRLTSGLQDQKSREQEQLDQTLTNRGIPVGSTAYSNAMRDFNKRYDDIEQGARETSVVQGANIGLGATGALSQVGQSGYYNPNFQQFQSVDYQQPNVQDVFNTFQGTQLGEKQIAADKEIAKIQADASKANAGLAASTTLQAAKINNAPGPSAPQTTPSPFNTKPPGS